MKILFINPPISNIIDPSLPEILLEKEDPMPPLGLMYLAADLERYTNHQVKILDCQIEKTSCSHLKEEITQEEPDVVGITTMTFTLPDVIKTIRSIKQVDPVIKVILGGPHVHIYPEETIKIKGVDYCVLGEGEHVLKDLLDNISNKENLYKIKGIVFRDRNRIINTGPPPLIEDLDSLPFPVRHLTDYKKYTSTLAKRFPVTTMITSRGCPFRCLFCDRPHLGHLFRARSAKNVVDEMEECSKMGIREILIYDDTFSVNRQRVLDICKEIQGRKLDITWSARTRVDTVDEEMLEQMKETGCQRIHYGVEAGTQRILNVLRKGITLREAEKAFHWTKKAGIQTLAYFVIGCPTETKEDISKTIEFARKIKPDYAHFTILTPYPATDIYYLGLQQRILPYDYWQEFTNNPTPDFKPYFWEENLSSKELIELMQKAYRSFYLSPRYIVKKILELRSWSEVKVKIRAGLNVLKI